MTNSSNEVLNKISDDEELIEAQTSRIENFKTNSRKTEKLCHNIADDNTDFSIQHIDEINNFLNQQF